MTSTIDARLGRERHVALLQRRIAFHQARLPDAHEETLRAKYTPINVPTTTMAIKSPLKGHLATTPTKVQPSTTAKHPPMEEAELPAPKRILFPPERVVSMLRWSRPQPIGAGLQNLGNTCFLNSVLQCLTYTPPLCQYLLSGVHGRECKRQTFCLMCEMEAHVRRCLGHKSTQPITPSTIVGKLRHVARSMHIGRQEDAHEYMRFFIEALQKSCLPDIPGLDDRSKETTFVYATFGGYLRSQVVCQSCKYRSNKYDPFLDISLDLHQVDSLHKALVAFTKAERLEGSNQYQCSRCRNKVNAIKRFSIHVAPNILTLQLKRFDFLRMAGQKKIGRPVEFTETLDIAPFMSGSAHNTPNVAPQPTKYRLYGVLVHSGASVHSGHYYSFVRSPAGVWYCMNDTSVSQVSSQTVLRQQAYILFYAREDGPTSTAPQPGLAPFVGQQPAKRKLVEYDDEDKVETETDAPAHQLGGKQMTPPATYPIPTSKTPPSTTGKPSLTANGKPSSSSSPSLPPAVKSAGTPAANGSSRSSSTDSNSNNPTIKKAKTHQIDDAGKPCEMAVSGTWVVRPSPTQSPQLGKSNLPPSMKSFKTVESRPSPFASNGIPPAHARTSLFFEPVGSWDDDHGEATNEDAKSNGRANAAEEAEAVADGPDLDDPDCIEAERRRKARAERDLLMRHQAREESRARRARTLDERDAEYDRGRMKKVKKQGHQREPGVHTQEGGVRPKNPFQQMQNERLHQRITP